MTNHHALLQFDSLPTTAINAFQLFQLKISLIHSFNPSELSFTAHLKDSSELFPNSYQLLNPNQIDSTQDTLLLLATPNGKFSVPSIYPQHKINTIVLYHLNLNINVEQIQYSKAPYNNWRPVETYFGNIHFPDQQSLLHSLPSLKNPPPPLPYPHPPLVR